jgi:VCBS repeat-containing protein
VNGAAFAGTFTSFNGTYGTLGLSSSGAWTYTLDNARAATNALAGGQQVTETFAVTARDSLGATGTGDIIVTLTGASDASPVVIANPDVLNINSSSNFTGSINVLSNDSSTNPGVLRLLSVNGNTPPSFGVYQFNSAFGEYHFNFYTGQIDYRARFDGTDLLSVPIGSVPEETLSYTVIDAAGATQTSTLTVRLPTKTQTPTALPDVATMAQGSTTASAMLFSNDSDPDGGALSLAAVARAGSRFVRAETLTLGGEPGLDFTNDYGYLTFSRGGAPGLFSFRADTAATGAAPTLFDQLSAGQIVSETFQYQVRDVSGSVTTSFVNLNIVGRNDAPTVTSAVGGVTEDAATATVAGAITFADIDSGDVPRISSVNGATFIGASMNFNGTYGSLSLSDSGVWTYALDNSRAVTQALNAGQQVDENFSVTVRDLSGATGVGAISLTINGADESLTAVNDLLVITPTSINSINLLANDLGDSANMRLGWVWSAVFDINPGGTTYSSSADFNFIATSNGNLSVGVRDSYFALKAGEVLERQYDYGLYGSGGFSLGMLTIRAIGANDAPTMNAPASILVSRTFDFALSLPSPTDVDSSALQVRFATLPSGGTLHTSSGSLISTSTLLSPAGAEGVYFRPSAGVTAPGSIVVEVTDGDGAVITKAIEFYFFPNEIIGTNGNDVLSGTGGTDTFFGLSGNDTFMFTEGEDIYFGGAGLDIVDFRFASPSLSANLINPNQHFHSIEGFLGTDYSDHFYGDEFDNYFVGRGDTDYLDSNGGNDILIGGAGTDYLTGGAGNDLLIDGNSRSILSGNDGNDLLVLQIGNYPSELITTGFYNWIIASGGSGADTFIIADEGSSSPIANILARISDFNWTENDKIDLSDLFNAGGQSLTFSDIQSGATLYSEAGIGVDYTEIKLNAYTGTQIPVTLDIIVGGFGGPAGLNANFFVFSNGVNWHSLLPADVPL